jgi:hypothetical protein
MKRCRLKIAGDFLRPFENGIAVTKAFLLRLHGRSCCQERGKSRDFQKRTHSPSPSLNYWGFEKEYHG